MDFDASTQARSWLFTRESLTHCHDHRAELDEGSRKVRNFASGFDRRFHKSQSEDLSDGKSGCSSSKGCNKESITASPCKLSLEEQEVVLRFHANQICRLVGPTALFQELVRSPKVVSTAILMFRRFYLSNNVIDFDCRHIALAACLLASKIEEERAEIEMLSYATVYTYQEARATPLYGSELLAMSVEEIEAAERALMEGLNYEMICFHPTDAVRLLASDLSDYFAKSYEGAVKEYAFPLGEDIFARAQAVCYRAVICSDAPFLFAPGRIGFAAATIALKSIDCEGLYGEEMEEFLRCRFSSYSKEELCTFLEEVDEIVNFLQDCPAMELSPRQSWNEAEELWQVLLKLANMHTMQISTPNRNPAVSTAAISAPDRKRSRLEMAQSQKAVGWTMRRKCPRVTPVSQRCSPIIGHA